LDDRPLTDQAVKMLMKEFPGKTGLSLLSIENAQLDDNKLGSIVAALPGDSGSGGGLKIIKLGKNTLTAGCAKHIAELLRKNGGITELHLNDNGIEDEGLEGIGDALKNYGKNLESMPKRLI